MIWIETPCERTCENPKPNCADNVTVPRCECKAEMVWNGQECVLPEECSCLVNGKV